MRELFGAVYESGFTFTEMTVSSKMEVFGVYTRKTGDPPKSSLFEGAVEQSETEGVPPLEGVELAARCAGDSQAKRRRSGTA